MTTKDSALRRQLRQMEEALDALKEGFEEVSDARDFLKEVDEAGIDLDNLPDVVKAYRAFEDANLDPIDAKEIVQAYADLRYLRDRFPSLTIREIEHHVSNMEEITDVLGGHTPPRLIIAGLQAWDRVTAEADTDASDEIIESLREYQRICELAGDGGIRSFIKKVTDGWDPLCEEIGSTPAADPDMVLKQVLARLAAPQLSLDDQKALLLGRAVLETMRKTGRGETTEEPAPLPPTTH